VISRHKSARAAAHLPTHRSIQGRALPRASCLPRAPWLTWTLGLSWALVLSACATESYEAAPLSSVQIEAVSALRLDVSPLQPGEIAGELSLAQAASWLRTRGPRVREILATWRTAYAVAQVGTPLPNPEVELGPLFGSGPGIDVNKVVPLASLSFSIPLSGRLGRQDELNQAIADRAKADALATFRELYLDLRSRYVSLAVARKREAVRATVVSSARESLITADILVAAGVATALDVSLFRLEHARERSRMLGARMTSANAASDLSDLVAVSPWKLGTIPEDALPVLPRTVPEPTSLQKLIVEEHPGLVRIRAEYAVAERQLHLEIAKQYPDLVIGGDFAGDPGDTNTLLGLTLGIALPIFDRNQQAIAEAKKRREEVRTRYESQAHRVLSSVERARATLALAAEQQRVLAQAVLPAAQTNVKIAEQSLAAGSAGALQMLDAERSLRQVQVEVLEAQLAEQLAWSNLEKAVGYPLVQFPTDNTKESSKPPSTLREDGPEATGAER
jgi:outer membrane protein, heavy metal efflux system